MSSILRRLISTGVLMVAMSIVILLGWSMITFMHTIDQGEISQAIIIAAEAVKYTLVDAETAQRGFIITGQKEYLEPYNTSLAVIDQQLLQLRLKMDQKTFEDSSGYSISILAHNKMDGLAKSIKLREDAGFEPARDFVLSHVGKRTMDDVRSIVQNIQETEAQRVMSSTHLIRQLSQIMIYSIIILVLCITFLGYFWTIRFGTDYEKQQQNSSGAKSG